MHVETEAKAVMHIETLNNVPGFFTMHKRGWVGAGILQPPRVRPFFFPFTETEAHSGIPHILTNFVV